MKKLFYVLITICFCFAINPLFIYSQESKNANLLVDTALKYRSAPQVQKALQKYHHTSEYPLIEEYVKSWVRKLIIQEDIDLATDLIFVLLDSNIDVDYDDDEVLDLYGEIISVYSQTRR